MCYCDSGIVLITTFYYCYTVVIMLSCLNYKWYVLLSSFLYWYKFLLLLHLSLSVTFLLLLHSCGVCLIDYIQPTENIQIKSLKFMNKLFNICWSYPYLYNHFKYNSVLHKYWPNIWKVELGRFESWKITFCCRYIFVHLLY